MAALAADIIFDLFPTSGDMLRLLPEMQPRGKVSYKAKPNEKGNNFLFPDPKAFFLIPFVVIYLFVACRGAQHLLKFTQAQIL